ncbi:MAG TPA: TonB family protein [Vicinamibacteria bacterium]
MSRREKFGKLVLLEETEATGMGTEHRSAKLGAAGLEKIVTILRLKPAISTNNDLARAVMDQAKAAAQLQNPNILKIFGIGKVEQSYYISYEHVEGKSLRAILDRCRQDSFPFQVEHALLIASKVASALEYSHGRRSDAGVRYFHGLLTPGGILVSYEGEVRVKGFGFWPSRVPQAQVLPPEELRYLAPEQASGAGDPRSDIYALGAVLFETLTGEAPGVNLVGRLGSARLMSPTGDDATLPKSLADILHKSVATDPAQRYGDMQEMRKAIDTLLFSGDFTPTTFNLAFFMHSLYRDDIERESRAIKEDKEASYHEFLGEEPKAPAVRPPSPAASNKTEPVDPRLIAAARAAATEILPPSPPEPAAEATSAPPPPPHAPTPAPASAPPSPPGPGLSAREAASGFTFHKEEAKANRRPLFLGLGAAAAVAGGLGGWLLLRRPEPAVPPPPPTTTLSPAAAAALSRVKELEEKLANLEREKVEAETKAAEDAKKKMEAQAAARGQALDAAAVERAQEDARRKAKEEQERRQQEELRRIADEKKAEEARLAEERRRAEEAARVAEQQRLEAARAAEQQAAAAPPTTTAPAPAPPTEPAAATDAPSGIRPGTLVNLTDPGVTPPVAEKAPPPVYPPIALRQRVEGTVELNVFVDEKGNVVETQVVQGAGGRAGLTEAAIDSVKRRRYRPATKDGVPVKVWLPVRVMFQLPR